jgi:hypothetical protein
MLVKVLGFGTNWWARFGRDRDDPLRFTRHAAYYNSTGFRCGRAVRRHWVYSGLIRFNGVGDFNPNYPERALGRIFVCSELSFAFGGSRLLFQSKAPSCVHPECYLVVLSSVEHGVVDLCSSTWKSVFSRVIAASQLREKQEVMLLMNSGDWVQTSAGFWQLQIDRGGLEREKLARIGDRVSP